MMMIITMKVLMITIDDHGNSCGLHFIDEKQVQRILEPRERKQPTQGHGFSEAESRLELTKLNGRFLVKPHIFQTEVCPIRE